MKRAITLLLLTLAPFAIAGSLMAQATSDIGSQQQALRDARARAVKAEARSDLLRQEAGAAASAADRIVAQRAVLAAEMAAAAAKIDAANARIAIITQRQRSQRARLGRESEPVLRLNAALQQMTRQPTVLMLAQPGNQADYIHLRAVMATVQPAISRRTQMLRAQIAAQNELRAQEVIALRSLDEARGLLQTQRGALARLESSARGRATTLTAGAAAEFERAIAQGERARDIVGRIDLARMSDERAAQLAQLDGPALRRSAQPTTGQARAYLLPASGNVVTGFSELNATGYRERGITLALPPSTPIVAPAAGTVSFAGRYRSYGQIVIIEHGNGWNSLITKMDAVQVTKGQRLAQGAVVGTSGEAGTEIGIELRKKGRTMDIATLLR